MLAERAAAEAKVAAGTSIPILFTHLAPKAQEYWNNRYCPRVGLLDLQKVPIHTQKTSNSKPCKQNG